MNSIAPLLENHAELIRVRGLVQGVGFRPTVWRLARDHDLAGSVRNDGAGVLILARASAEQIDRFLEQLKLEVPVLARIDSVEREVVEMDEILTEFRIGTSVADMVRTGLIADAATCPECIAEIFDPENRRAGFAFTNCTHCGPRLSIVSDIPYDRANTSMAAFELCSCCWNEYSDPIDRRFHAQPTACPDCGPRLQLVGADGVEIECADPITATADLVRGGKIVAIKGLGGYQLACDAANEAAVRRLRERKQRPRKPLALMAADLDQVEEYCEVSDTERQILASSAAPILLLERGCAAQTLASAIAPGQHRLGFMLPNSPLHHLLMRQLPTPIVLTSGNRSGQPQIINDAEALTELASVADCFLCHDRTIVNRVDDSVGRVIDGDLHLYRRARGYAPASLALSRTVSADRRVLACGGELKSTFCLWDEGRAILSQHIGDLENGQACIDYETNLELYRRLFQFDPELIAVDAHPEYLSSKHGRALAAKLHLPLVEVQHHHAHIAACLADNGWTVRQGSVLGIAMDGLGFGDDGTIWGGEFLLADYHGYRRVARLKPAHLPGGSRAILEPWRNAVAQLDQNFDWDHLMARLADTDLACGLQDKPVATVRRMIAQDVNAPLTSSCGRLFDAVAVAVGVAPDKISYEGEAAVALENCMGDIDLNRVHPYRWSLQAGDVAELDPATMWRELCVDLISGRSAAEISASFHRGLAASIANTATEICALHGVRDIALSGGVFQNSTLFDLCLGLLRAQGLNVMFHRQVPANDGGLSLGQAAVAAARYNLSES